MIHDVFGFDTLCFVIKRVETVQSVLIRKQQAAAVVFKQSIH